MLVFLLLVGYAAMGFWLDRELHPISGAGTAAAAGLAGRGRVGPGGWLGAGRGLRLPLVVGGGIAIVLVLAPSAWGWLAGRVAFFALAALAEEVAFRGYGFQRFERCRGPAGRGAGLCGLLCHCAVTSARIEPGQRRRLAWR